MEKIRANHEETLHAQASLLRHDLYTLISESSPGRMLPSERFLTHKYNVSRTTVAKVFNLLAEEGLVERQHGRGTLVKGKAVITFLLPCPGFLSSPTVSACIIRQRMQGAMAAAQERNLGFETIAVSPVNNFNRVDYSLLSRINAGSMVILDEWFRTLFPLLADRRARVALIGKESVPYGYAQYTKSWHHLVLNSAQSVADGLRYLKRQGCQKVALIGAWLGETHHPVSNAYKKAVAEAGMPELIFELYSGQSALSAPPVSAIREWYTQAQFDGILLSNGYFDNVQMLPCAESVQTYLGIPESVQICGIDQHLPQMPFRRQFPFFRAPNEQTGYDAVAILADSPGGQRQDKLYDYIFQTGEENSAAEDAFEDRLNRCSNVSQL